MKLKILTPFRTILMFCAIAAFCSCNSTPDNAAEAQKQSNDSIQEENKEVSLKPAGPAPAWGTDINLKCRW